jgi:hypothetical protein
LLGAGFGLTGCPLVLEDDFKTQPADAASGGNAANGMGGNAPNSGNKQVAEDDVPREYLENDLDRLNRKSPVTRNIAAKETATSTTRVAKQNATSTTRVSRGPVDAPGKRHRKPVPQEPIDKRLGEPRGKQMGQKNPKRADRGGRR